MRRASRASARARGGAAPPRGAGPRGPRGPVHPAGREQGGGRPAAPGTIAVRPEASPPLDPAALDEAARLLGRSSRPLLLLGQHCRAADAPWLRALAEALPGPAPLTPN